jgi:hypothetical protein
LEAESAANRRSLRVAQEPEFYWEEQVVDVFGGVSSFPERKARMRLFGWERDFPVQSYPDLLV